MRHDSHILNSVESTWQLMNWRQLRLSWQSCPVCRTRTPVLRLNQNEISVRCLKCRSSAITMSLISVLNDLIPDLRQKSVYEMSSRGPLLRYLVENAGELTFSEYFDNIAPGEKKGSVQCQDAERLTYRSFSFDICTSMEVFEHVPDDMQGFSEICRVLKPGGLFIFTVPLFSSHGTVERARKLENGDIEYLLSPEYHGDNIRGWGRVLAFRNYGTDIVARLRRSGFADAMIRWPPDEIPWGYARPVVVGIKGQPFDRPL